MMANQDKMGAVAPGTVALLGVPTDENSSFLRGPALAPARIREALFSGSANLCTERDLDLGGEPRFQDVGNLVPAVGLAMIEQVEEAVATLLAREAFVLSLGGDHAITYPIARAYAKKHGPLTILHLDAHPDLYDEFEGSRYSHACPFARVLEEGWAARLVQVGIRTMTPHLREQAERFGVEIHEARAWSPASELALDGPLYLSLDLDVLDPAFAPGVSHHEPGGLSTRDVLRIIHGLRGPVVGADIVEFNPVRDPLGITAMVAAKFLKEIVACMIETNPALT